jgi:hypothetical protein
MLRRVATVLTVVLPAVLLGAAAQAAIPDQNSGTFHGCVNKRTGVLRVIDPFAGGKCSTIRGLEETPIQWSQTGPGGNPGPAPSAANLIVKRTTSITLRGTEFITAAAECDAGDVSVNGYWTVDSHQPQGNPAIYYSLGDTGETETGYQVKVGRESSYTGPDPVVAVTAVCLNTA